MSSLQFMDTWKWTVSLEMFLIKLGEQNWLLSNQHKPSDSFQKLLSNKCSYEKEQVIHIKGNFKSSIRGQFCST